MTVRVLSKGRVAEGRTLVADFGNQTSVAAQFDLANFSYTTDANDSARPCISATVDGTLATLTAKTGFQFRDTETRMRCWVPGSGISAGSNLMQVRSRYQDASNFHYATKNFNTGATSANARVAASTSAVGTFAQADVSTGYWDCKFRVVGAAHWCKWWPEDGAEPGWQIAKSIEPLNGNWIQLGVPMLAVQFMGATLITDFVVTELL
jgi:hypothetical protein